MNLSRSYSKNNKVNAGAEKEYGWGFLRIGMLKKLVGR